MLVSEALQAFKSGYIAVRGLSSSTQHNYEEAVGSFIHAVGDVDIAKLKSSDVLAWRHCMEARNKPGTIRANLSKLKNILIYTNKKGVTNFDIEDIHLPKLPPPLPEFLYPSEVEELINATVSLRNKALISLLFTAGLRAGEAARLTKRDVDGLTVYIRQAKCSSSRTVFMGESTRKLLDEYLTSRTDKSDIIFYSYRGGALDPATINKEIKKIAARTTITKPVHTHILRHSFATALVRGGVDISFVQRMLGHAFVNTTMIYVHLTNTDLYSAHKKVFN